MIFIINTGCHTIGVCVYFFSEYFSNFKVFVEHALENETGKFDVPKTRSLCYEHGRDTPTSTTINVTCDTPIIGNQVRIQTANLNTKLELCDVAISGGAYIVN